MKKQILLPAIALFAAGMIWTTGCKKADTTAPVITLKGNATEYVILGNAWTDAGATANDDKDGDVTSSITVSGTVNQNMAASYTIKYSVSDAAGNVGTADRTVIVYNQACLALSGSYSSTGVNYTVKDSVVALPPNTTFPQTVTFDNTVNNRIHFSKFANYSNNAGVYADISGTTITIPSQSPTGIGSASETHTFQGNGVVIGTKFTLHFTDINVTGGGTADDYEWFN